MTEPYIQVYAADMRADLKIGELTPGECYLLVQAWDLAKNSPVVGELRKPNGEPVDDKTLAQVHPRVTPKQAARFLIRAVEVGLAQQADDGALVFPRLVRRQRPHDPGNATRQRKYRERRNGARNVTGNVTQPVTRNAGNDVTRNAHRNVTVTDPPSSPPSPSPTPPSSFPPLSPHEDSAKASSSSPAPLRQRPRDELWDELAAQLGHQPASKSERGKWNAAVAQLREADVSPGELRVLVAEYRTRWNVELTPTALASNLGRLRAGHASRPAPPAAPAGAVESRVAAQARRLGVMQ